MVIRGAVSHFLGRWITSHCPPAVIIERLWGTHLTVTKSSKNYGVGVVHNAHQRLQSLVAAGRRNLREDNLDVVHWIISSWVSRLCCRTFHVEFWIQNPQKYYLNVCCFVTRHHRDWSKKKLIMIKNGLLIKNLQFLSYHHETYSEWFKFEMVH